MIRLVKKPKVSLDCAEGIRISELFKAYGDYAMFWHQDGGKAVISMLEGDMIISGKVTDYEELSLFLGTVAPNSIFANIEVLSALDLLKNSLTVSVMESDRNYYLKEKSAVLSSADVYGILKKAEFELPVYDYFATDFCLRLNKGRLTYFGVPETAVAICIGKKAVLINGLASLKKGYGSKCLEGLMSNARPEKAFVCAKKDVEGFYIKNGFKTIYQAGYWRK